MIRSFIALAALVMAVPATAQTTAAQIPEDAPNWRTMTEAIELAKANDRLLVIHSYTVWCGWCVRMDRETYTDDAVQEYLDAHYEATRLDLDSDEVVSFFDTTAPMAALGDALQVSGTPTTVFVDSDGSLITKMPGFQDAATFLHALQYVKEEAYETVSFAEFIEAKAAASLETGR